VVSKVDCSSFVDCGAYVGDTLQSFYESPNYRCNSYIALEPDRKNAERLKEYVTQNQIQDVTILQLGTWDRADTLRFCGNKSVASRLSELGERGEDSYEVNVDTLDCIMEGRQVGFIKMDIEGAEIAALHGARKILKQQKPILAISVYHRMSDLWKIPLLIREMNPDYKLYFRHHTQTSGDTICYAI